MGQEINIMIVTGGHGFDRPAFFEMFNSFERVRYQEVQQPMANALIEKGEAMEYDVLVFYDMYDSITPSQKKAYIDLLKNGKAMVFLHHSLVSYQRWDEFLNIIGGKYNAEDGSMKLSYYEHDVMIPVRVADTQHPITRGLKDFTIHDETYGDCIILPQVQPLLSTNHPRSLPHIAWIHRYGKSDVVYIQLGHGPESFHDSNYRQLLRQAIEWSATHH